MSVILSKFLIYLFFSILVGRLITILIPKGKIPEIQFPKAILLLAVAFIPLLSFFPILSVTQYMAEQFEEGFWLILSNVMFSFALGKAWFITLGISIFLFILIAILYRDGKNEPTFSIVSLVLTFGLILSFGWSSHAATQDPLTGFFAQTAHFLAITVWIGVLFVTSWFSLEDTRWLNFLTWYTPLAIICVLTVTFSGIALMSIIVPEPYNSWMLTYGQALLFKHLLFIPLITYGLINGFLLRRKLESDPQFNPKPWLRAESIIALLIFSVTAYMSQQAAPHEVGRTLQFVEPSSLFLTLYQGFYNPNMMITLGFNWLSTTLALTALLSLSFMVITYLKKGRALYTIGLGLLFVALGYLAIMTAIL